MSTSNMLWNMVKPNSKALYFFGCMTVACAQLSAAGSPATAGGLSAQIYLLVKSYWNPLQAED